jgi:osmotically-inducible protein OsmY
METMKAARWALSVVLATSLMTASPSAQGAPRKDFQIALDILTAVLNYDRYTIFDDVSANVKDGVATLTGKVTQPDKRTEIEKRVQRIKGVSAVRNQIEVLPPSKFDEDLRIRVANTIYNNSAFWQYSTLDKPPIHILVEGSHVTLTGVVRSDLDKKLAQSLAMQAGAGNLTNKLQTEAEARQGLEK